MQWRHCNDCMHSCLSFFTQHWQKLSPHGPDTPMERSGHAAICFTSQLLDLQSTLVLILGGRPDKVILGRRPDKDCWVCDVQAVKWMRVSLVCENVLDQW